MLQSWLQSLPQLGLISWMALCNMIPEGPTYKVNNVIFLLVSSCTFVAAHVRVALLGLAWQPMNMHVFACSTVFQAGSNSSTRVDCVACALILHMIQQPVCSPHTRLSMLLQHS